MWGRFAVMTTGAPQFKPIDNPASFSDSWTTKVLYANEKPIPTIYLIPIKRHIPLIGEQT